MSFDDIRLPVDVEQGAKGGPNFQTSIVALSSGNEQRNQDWSAPRQAWDIGYGIGDRENYESVRDFFYARRGRQRGFLFKDWSDYTVTNQLLGTGNGTLRTFLLVKTYENDGPSPFTRRITRPDLTTLVVRVNDVVTTAFVTGDGGWIRFTPGNAPANDAEVRADFEFDVPVRFAIDTFPLQLGWSEVGSIDSIPVVETRDDFNAPPTDVSLTGTTTSMAENTSTATRIKVADISVTDDPFGFNVLSLTGADAASFELDGDLNIDGIGGELYLKADVVLNYEVKAAYNVTVNVDDPLAAGAHPQATENFTLTLTDVNEAPDVILTNRVYSLPDDEDTTGPIAIANVTVIDDALGLRALTLSGADAASFTLDGSLTWTGTDPITGLRNYTGVTLNTVAGLDYSVQTLFEVTVEVADSGLPSPPQGTFDHTLQFGVAPGVEDSVGTGAKVFAVPVYATLTIELWGPGAGGHGFNTSGTTPSGDTTLASLSLTAGKGFAASGTLGGLGGTATGGDVNQNGKPGNTGVNFRQGYLTGDAFTTGVQGIQFYTAAGGNAGDDLGGGPSTTGAFYNFELNTYTNINVNGADATSHGGAGAGSVQYGADSRAASGGFFGVYGYGKGSPSGGGGAKVTKTFIYGVTPGAPEPGSNLNYVIGPKGIGGVSFADGGDGADGHARFTWS